VIRSHVRLTDISAFLTDAKIGAGQRVVTKLEDEGNGKQKEDDDDDKQDDGYSE
jgi:hypothetical protein